MLGLVCEKMATRVVVPRQEEEDRRVSQETVTVDVILEEDPGERRTRKMLRSLQTRERSDRSQT